MSRKDAVQSPCIPEEPLAEHLADRGIDMSDFQREQERLIAAYPEEEEIIRRSRAVHDQIIMTLEERTKMGQDALTGATSLRKYKDRIKELQASASARRERRARGQTRHTDTPEELSEPFAIISIDIDHFKQINDTYGHKAGDAVLRGIVDRIKSRIRITEGDFVARNGGEEFLSVILAVNGKAPAVAESLRQLIESEPFVYRDPLTGVEHHIDVTISLGVAPYDEDTVSMELRADAALYAAKGKGRSAAEPHRNQVWLWDRETVKPVPYKPPA